MDKIAVLALLRKSGKHKNLLESNNPVLLKRGLDCGFEFLCEIEDKEVALLIGFDKHFPFHRPHYFLLPGTTTGHIPHVESNGWICYMQEDYSSIDYDNPEGIIFESLAAVMQTLKKGYLKENLEDFLKEFEAYWRQLDGCQTIYSNLVATDKVKKIKIGQRENKGAFVLDDTEESSDIVRRILGDSKVSHQNAIYIPLKPGSCVMPPPYNHRYSLEEIRLLIEENVSDDNKKLLPKLLNNTAKNCEYIILTQRQPNGIDCFFGFKFSKIKPGMHPLLDSSVACKIDPISIERLDKAYLTRRGGSGDTFDNKKGLVIGCGSIGGYIIEELAKSGFLNLTAVDRDKLTPENSYRHVCGIAYLDANKAQAIKRKIEKYYPHALINAVPDTIENLLSEKKIDLGMFDFIVVATGNVTINMMLNELLFQKYRHIPTFFSWLDPYGIGGHCLVTNLKTQGCYHCLYNNDDVFNIASFAKMKQPKPFLKAISGCGSVYTPFSSMDACQTALLTVRTIIKTLKGKEDKAAVYSWKGDAEAFIAEGFELSERFGDSEQELLNKKSNFFSPNCKVCKI